MTTILELLFSIILNFILAFFVYHTTNAMNNINEGWMNNNKARSFDIARNNGYAITAFLSPFYFYALGKICDVLGLRNFIIDIDRGIGESGWFFFTNLIGRHGEKMNVAYTLDSIFSALLFFVFAASWTFFFCKIKFNTRDDTLLIVKISSGLTALYFILSAYMKPFEYTITKQTLKFFPRLLGESTSQSLSADTHSYILIVFGVSGGLLLFFNIFKKDKKNGAN